MPHTQPPPPRPVHPHPPAARAGPHTACTRKPPALTPPLPPATAPIAAWAAADDQELDDAWVDQVVDLGLEWGQYEYGTNVGFAA